MNPTPQHKDTTLDDLLSALDKVAENNRLYGTGTGQLASMCYVCGVDPLALKQALLQWRNKAVVEALQNVLNEYANQYQKHVADMGRTETPFTIFHKIINDQLKETPNED